VVAPEALDDPFLALRHDAHALGDGDRDEDEKGEDDGETGTEFHDQLPIRF
jgi:hypothetical protein